MADAIRYVPPDAIERNPENPRLIFHEAELRELQDSIAVQGILVPLTVFETKTTLVILDGERRWRCARRLGLAQLPVIVQPEPARMQNIMMMFAIHNTRKQWDPLPTAFKLRDLEELYVENEGARPTESQLAQVASITRGEVRRLKAMLALPEHYLDELMGEAEKPRVEQTLTVDHVLEATRGAQALRKRDIIDGSTEKMLTEAIVDKYRTGVVGNTVEPRKLAKIARAVERDELPPAVAARVVQRLIDEPTYSVERAFDDSVARIDYEHTLEQQADRLSEKLESELPGPFGEELTAALQRLKSALSRVFED